MVFVMVKLKATELKEAERLNGPAQIPIRQRTVRTRRLLTSLEKDVRLEMSQRRNMHERSLKFKTSLTNLSEKTLPLYIEEAGPEREGIIEFQRYTNPTHLALYGQV
jgi:hypothetical protein